jgi:hypothetical protein
MPRGLKVQGGSGPAGKNQWEIRNLPIASPPSPGRENIPRKTDGEREILIIFIVIPGDFMLSRENRNP